MRNSVQVLVKQIGPTASEGRVRGHKFTMDRPVTKGGEDRGPMGGETLLMALGGCFMSNLLAAAAARETALAGVQFEIAGTLESAPPRFTAIAMRIKADQGEDAAQLPKLVEIAERGCIVANTLKTAVVLTIEIDA
jgi:putative redox protein